MEKTNSSADFNICDKSLAGKFERETTEVVILPRNFDIGEDRLVVGTQVWGSGAPLFLGVGTGLE